MYKEVYVNMVHGHLWTDSLMLLYFVLVHPNSYWTGTQLNKVVSPPIVPQGFHYILLVIHNARHPTHERGSSPCPANYLRP